LINVRFVFMRFLQLVRTAVTLASHCDETVTHMTLKRFNISSIIEI
jgi:hypothetical protein